MKPTSARTFTCQICKKQKSQHEMFPGYGVRPALVEIIRKKYPRWSNESFICLSDLDAFRKTYVQSVLELEKGELSKLDKEVLHSLNQQEIITKNIEKEFDQKTTFGQKLSDKMASFGGSWRFIILFFLVLLAWICINAFALFVKPFDPFPFILLNLVLSCIAAIQAPVIMMSQNRKDAKDRLRGEHDYKVNLKAELEIRHLHEKMDHLVHTQWQRLLEIQQVQLELLQEQQGKRNKK